MEKDDLEYFVAGLKKIIRNSWPTQEEFAKGVTSKVNLSNIIRGTGGTSLEMRRKLAAKAGMSVEDVIALGKGTLRFEPDIRHVTAEPASPGVSLGAEELSNMSSAELISVAGGYSSEITDQMMAHAKQVGVTVKMLADERNRIMGLLQQEQEITNSIEETIKVVNKDMRIVYCNQAHAARYRQVEGDHCAGASCGQCKGDCVAEKVFVTGRPDQSLIEIQGSWLYRTAYPMKSEIGKIDRVVIVSREMNDLIQMLEQYGWDCRPKKKK